MFTAAVTLAGRIFLKAGLYSAGSLVRSDRWGLDVLKSSSMLLSFRFERSPFDFLLVKELINSGTLNFIYVVTLRVAGGLL